MAQEIQKQTIIPESKRKGYLHESLGPNYEPGPVTVSTWKGGREENQDAFFSLPVMFRDYLKQNERNGLLALSAAGYELVIVADGIGGHSKGGEASSRLTREVVGEFISQLSDFYRQITHRSLDLSSPEQIQKFVKETLFSHLPSLLRHAIVEGNKSIRDIPGYEEVTKKPGSTIVATFFDRNTNRHVIANVGDSRAQRITNRGKIKPITQDHSPIQRMYRAGDLTEEEARNNPRRNELDRSLNGQDIGKPHDYIDIFSVQLKPGEALILNSDGLEELSRAEIEKVIKETRREDTSIDRALVAAVDRKQLLALAEKMEFSGLFTGEEVMDIFRENEHKIKNSELAGILFEKIEIARREAIYQELKSINVASWAEKDLWAEKLKNGDLSADAIINEVQRLVDEGIVKKVDVNHLLNGKRFRRIEGYNHDNITVITIGEVKQSLRNEFANTAHSILDSARSLLKGNDNKYKGSDSITVPHEQGSSNFEKISSTKKAKKLLKKLKEKYFAAGLTSENINTQSSEGKTNPIIEQSVQDLLTIFGSKNKNLLFKLGLLKSAKKDRGGLSLWWGESINRQRNETSDNQIAISDLEARIETNKKEEKRFEDQVFEYLFIKYGSYDSKNINNDDHSFIEKIYQNVINIRSVRADLERELEELKEKVEKDAISNQLSIDHLSFNPKRKKQVKESLERMIARTEDENDVREIREALQKHLHTLEQNTWKPF